VVVIGAGVFGLWVAREALHAGLSVVVTDRAGPGAGASGGVVGALTPHMPVRWRPLKELQLRALLSLEAEAASLTAETGLETGYRRAGRLSPLIDARARARAEEQALAAREVWRGEAAFRVLDTPPEAYAPVLPPESCAEGCVSDTLSARIDPRRYLQALGAAVERSAEIRRGWTAREVSPEGHVRFDRGEIQAGNVVIAAGWESFPLAPVAQGQGVKGQAAVLGADLPEDMPVIQAPDLYVVRQGRGRVAVGSTSEKVWDHGAPDQGLEAVIDRARRFCPGLSTAPVLERWAGIRPKAPGREPMAGPVPGTRIVMATGGYKIGLGIAHEVGKALAAGIAGQPHPALPPEFAPQPQRESPP
ncbi:MAG: FAD-dependent oxidoreductase, partial [Pseudomonadota bacterium]